MSRESPYGVDWHVEMRRHELANHRLAPLGDAADLDRPRDQLTSPATAVARRFECGVRRLVNRVLQKFRRVGFGRLVAKRCYLRRLCEVHRRDVVHRRPDHKVGVGKTPLRVARHHGVDHVAEHGEHRIRRGRRRRTCDVAAADTDRDHHVGPHRADDAGRDVVEDATVDEDLVADADGNEHTGQ